MITRWCRKKIWISVTTSQNVSLLLYILQGSVATNGRCGGRLCYKFTAESYILLWKNIVKLVIILWRSVIIMTTVATVSLWISQISLILAPACRLHVVCITLDIMMWSHSEGKPICKLTGIENRSTHDNGLTFNLRSSSDRTIVVVRPTQRRGWRP